MVFISTILFALSHFFFNGFSVLELVTLFFFEGILFSSILIERFILREGNPLATLRRLSNVALFSNALWLFVLCLGFAFSVFLGRNIQRQDSFMLLSFLYVVAFRLMIFNAAFFGTTLKKTVPAVLQPSLLVPLLVPSAITLSMYTAPIIEGIIVIASIVAFLFAIDRIAFRFLNIGTLTLFSAFISAWATGYPDTLEELLDRGSSPSIIRTKVLEFSSEKVKAAIVVPEVHPGPFYPIGSSNLPYQIQRWFLDRGFSTLILHGVSGHELNLPSKKEVEKFILGLDNLTVVGSGQTCTLPIICKVGKATTTCLAFEEVAFVMLTVSPYGIEDLPVEIRQTIENMASKIGYSNVIIIDTHNSIGISISREDFDDLVFATEKALKDMKSLIQKSIKVGYAHSAELDLKFAKDVGTGGLSTLIIDIGGKKYSIIAIDSNNAVAGLREKLMKSCEDLDAPILEICTTDTHITAGKTTNRKGYFALGDLSDVEGLSRAIRTLIDKSTERISPVNFQVKQADTNVKIIGGLLENLSKIIDSSMSLMKRSMPLIICLSFAFIILTTII